LLHEPGQTTTTTCNNHKCCMKNLTSFKFEPTTPNMSQHFATCGNSVAKRKQHVVPNNVVVCCIEILQSFGRGLLIKMVTLKFNWLLFLPQSNQSIPHMHTHTLQLIPIFELIFPSRSRKWHVYLHSLE